MAGFQQTPWSSGPYATPGPFGFSSLTPGSVAWPQSYGAPLPFAPLQAQQVHQLLQIVPLQIQQLQQLIQYLPQQIAQIVAQTVSQGQANVPIQGTLAYGSPFQPIPAAGTQLPIGQPGYVM